MKIMLEIASIDLLPFDKMANLIAKGKPIYIPLETWNILQTWPSLEKG